MQGKGDADTWVCRDDTLKSLTAIVSQTVFPLKLNVAAPALQIGAGSRDVVSEVAMMLLREFVPLQEEISEKKLHLITHSLKQAAVCK